MKKKVKVKKTQVVKKKKCECCCGRQASGKSKASKVAKLKKIASRNRVKGKKSGRKGLFGWFRR